MNVRFNYTIVSYFSDTSIKTVVIPDIKNRREIKEIFKENCIENYTILDVKKVKNHSTDIISYGTIVELLGEIDLENFDSILVRG